MELVLKVRREEKFPKAEALRVAGLAADEFFKPPSPQIPRFPTVREVLAFGSILQKPAVRDVDLIVLYECDKADWNIAAMPIFKRKEQIQASLSGVPGKDIPLDVTPMFIESLWDPAYRVSYEQLFLPNFMQIVFDDFLRWNHKTKMFERSDRTALMESYGRLDHRPQELILGAGAF